MQIKHMEWQLHQTSWFGPTFHLPKNKRAFLFHMFWKAVHFPIPQDFFKFAERFHKMSLNSWRGLFVVVILLIGSSFSKFVCVCCAPGYSWGEGDNSLSVSKLFNCICSMPGYSCKCYVLFTWQQGWTQELLYSLVRDQKSCTSEEKQQFSFVGSDSIIFCSGQERVDFCRSKCNHVSHKSGEIIALWLKFLYGEFEFFNQKMFKLNTRQK